jgi:hypothetical protein
MAKKILIMGVALIMCLGILSGCGNEMEDRIRNDYLSYLHSQGETEATLNDVKILNNYGNYNEVVVVRMERPAFEVLTGIQVGGVDFTFNNSNTALVWKEGQFYELAEAYDLGLLSKDDLTSLAKKVNK